MRKLFDTGGLVRKNAEGVETVLVNIDSKQSIYSVLGHETKHLLEKYALNDKFDKFLFDYAKGKGDLKAVQDRIEGDYSGIENADFDSEVSADLTGKYLFEDDKFLDTLLAQKSDSKVQQIITQIKALIDDLVVKFKGTDQEKQLRNVQKKFLELYNSTDADVVEDEAQKNTTDEGDVKYSLDDSKNNTAADEKITRNTSDEERARILSNKKIQNISFVKSLSSDKIEKIKDISSWEDIDKLFGKKKRGLIKKIAQEFGTTGKDYSNSDVNLSFHFSNNNFEESYNKQKINYKTFAKMFSVFDKVIESAVGVEVHNRNAEGYKYDPTLENAYVLISAFGDGDSIIPVKLEVKEFNDKKNTLYVAVSLEAIKKTEVLEQGNTIDGVTQNSRPVNISIPNLLKKINPNDIDLLKYLPNELLNDEQKKAKTDFEYNEAVKNNNIKVAQKMVDEAAENSMPNSVVRDGNGKLLTVYHGSPSKFTVFDHNKMNVHGNAHGRGFYFTEEKSLAEGYQKNDGQLLKGYLNITNPMSEEKVTIKKPDLIKLIQAICEEEAKNMVADEGYGSVEDALRDTWVSNYVYTYGTSINNAYKEAADIIYSNDNDVDIVAELTNVTDTETVLKKVHEVLGYDGVIYTNERGTHEYVSLISNQFKSSDPVTYDDNGNVIPLSQRFNEGNDDTRYTLSNQTKHPIQTTKDDIGYDDCYNYLSDDGLSGFSITPDGRHYQCD